MNIAIIDDLMECRKEIRTCLTQFYHEQYPNDVLSIQEFSNGSDFISNFSKEQYDLIFLDQYMEELSGIDTAKHIREIDELVTLVFITTSREHAVDSYQVRASGYLLKPFTYKDFEAALKLAGIAKLRNARCICVQDQKLLLRDILWCDLDGHYTQIHTQDHGLLRYRLPFSALTELLLPYSQFLTCYKGCIINLDHVDHMLACSFVLNNGEELLFPKRDRRRMEEEYHTYLFQKAREDVLL